MRPLSQRMLDVYRLQQRYRYELWAFQFGGMLLALLVLGNVVYDLRFSFGAVAASTPVAPATPTSIALSIAAVLLTCACGVVLGSLAHAAFLAISGRLSWRDAVGATLLSRYPKSWFR